VAELRFGTASQLGNDLDAVLHPEVTQLGVIPEDQMTMPAAEHTDLYATPAPPPTRSTTTP
jgi:hypothetical protein